MILRIGIAAAHPAVHDGLRTLLDVSLTCVIVGEAPSAQAAIAIAQRLRPQVLVIDQEVLEQDGLRVIRHVHCARPNIGIVLLSMYTHAEQVVAALHAGALAYVLKETAAAELGTAIETAAVGQRYVSPLLAEPVLAGMESSRVSV